MFQVVFQEKHCMIYSQGCGFEGGVQPADVLRFVWTVPLFETLEAPDLGSTHGQRMVNTCCEIYKKSIYMSFGFGNHPLLPFGHQTEQFLEHPPLLSYIHLLSYIFCVHDFPVKKNCIFVMSSHQNGFFRRWFEMWSATETMPRWKSTFCRLDGGCQWAFPVDFPVKKKTLMDSLWNAKTLRKWGKNFTYAKFI